MCTRAHQTHGRHGREGVRSVSSSEKVQSSTLHNRSNLETPQMSISHRHYKCPSHSVGYSVLTSGWATHSNMGESHTTMPGSETKQEESALWSTKSLENQTKLICDVVGPRVTLERCRRGGTGSRHGRKGIRSVSSSGCWLHGGVYFMTINRAVYLSFKHFSECMLYFNFM